MTASAVVAKREPGPPDFVIVSNDVDFEDEPEDEVWMTIADAMEKAGKNPSKEVMEFITYHMK